MRILLVWLVAALIFGTFYMLVQHKEKLRRDGQTIYLALTPVDPRSPLQGDYMDLDYDITHKLTIDQSATQGKEKEAGEIVVQLDARHVASFVRYHHGEVLAPNEHLLKYRHDHWPIIIGAETYFIPEGSGDVFAHATFGELKVEADGTPLLIGLCDKDLNLISPDNSHDSR